MAKKTIKAQMKQRRDTKANWAATNPVLLDGELGIVSDDPNLYKVGDGATAWNDLPFRGFDGTLAQELGTSPNAVISQKVVSEKLTELESEVIAPPTFVPRTESESAKIRAFIQDVYIVNADNEDIYISYVGMQSSMFVLQLKSGDFAQNYKIAQNLIELDKICKLPAELPAGEVYEVYVRFAKNISDTSLYATYALVTSVGKGTNVTPFTQDFQTFLPQVKDKFIELENAIDNSISNIDNSISNIESLLETLPTTGLSFDKILSVNQEITSYFDRTITFDSPIIVPAGQSVSLQFLRKNLSGIVFAAWFMTESGKQIILQDEESLIYTFTEDTKLISYGINSSNPSGNSYADAIIRYSIGLYPQLLLAKDNIASLSNKVSTLEERQIIHVVKTVKQDGGGDYSTLKEAFDSITDSSYNKRYIIEFHGNGTEYDLLQDCPMIDGEIGLTVPPFTKLKGVGGKEKCILVRRLLSGNMIDSPLNLYGTSELEGLTVIGKNTRYVIHDDYVKASLEMNLTNYCREIRDCEFISEGLSYGKVYGAGTRSGFNWKFTNVKFEAPNVSNISFSNHNNVAFTRPSRIEFDNCRFNAVTSTDCVSFGTLNTNANGIENYVVFKGCRINKLKLIEEKVASYGAGILFKVSGYANDLKTGSDSISIVATDGVDYSGNIDLL